MKHAFFVLTLVILVVIFILLWQIWRKFKSIPEDEVIGEERTAYMRHRLTWVAICSIAEALLQIAAAVLRFLEII